MGSIRNYLHFCFIGLLVLPPISLPGQFIRSACIETGAGVNFSYFDVGGGTPGLSIHGGVLYDLAPSWKIGANIGIHRASGTDEGTTEADRGYAFRSNLYELAAKGVYVLRFREYPGKKWKTIIEPRAYATLGILQFLARPNLALASQGEGKYLPVAPFCSAGVGLAFRVSEDIQLLIEGGGNVCTSDYLEGYSGKGDAFSPDYFLSLLVKVVVKIPAYGY